ncbi:MAG TPA: ABC transporter permease [Terriglobales bacterium]|nr:ABC transporter permease [Terriglobales bacterium]
MNLASYMRSLAAKLLHREQIAEEVDEELRAHIQLRADDLQRAGMARSEAERQARIEFGGQERFKEECQEALGGNFLEIALNDLRYAVRMLRKTPGFTMAAIFTLALAIGANAVVFSVMNSFLLHPFKLPHADRLYAVWRPDVRDAHESYPDYLDLRDRNRSFESLAAFNATEAGMNTGKEPFDAWIMEGSGNYFDALGVRPYLGRVFHASDEHGPDSAPYIVLSYGCWHGRFHDDPAVIGSTIQLNKHPFTIIGVTQPGFHGTLVFFNVDGFVPLVNHAAFGQDDPSARKDRWVFMALGRLKEGVTTAQATADLNAIGSYFEKTYPKEDGRMRFTVARPGLYGDYLGGPVTAFMTGLMLLSGLILLAACANLGSLFASRAADRSREVALRLALGSTRTRILRGLFTEAVLISLMGGAIGLLGSIVLLRALSAWQPMPRFPVQMPVNPDGYVYAVALLLSLVSGFLFGAVPVRQVLRTNPYEIVKLGGTRSGGRRLAARDLLLVVQIAICAVLVTASLVAVRGLARSLHNDFGFDPENRIVVDTDLTMAGYSSDQVPAMQKRIQDALAAIPGVESVGLGDGVPLGENQPDSNVFREDTANLISANAVADANRFDVSPEYLHAAGTNLLAGRGFTWHDDQHSPLVAIVNQEFARRMFGSEAKALGSFFKTQEGKRIQVVGIVETGKYNSLPEDPHTAMFLPILQRPSSSTWLIVHSDQDPQQLGAAIRSTLHNLDAALPVSIRTRFQVMDFAFFGPRMATISLGVLGLMGAMLSITGIFGMAAYSISKRLKELGIRVALGAKREEILQAALGRAFRLLMFGSVAGLLLGILASRVLALIVYQATPRDPLVLAGAVIAMLLLGLLATWIPAQRALHVDPVILLREE